MFQNNARYILYVTGMIPSARVSYSFCSDKDKIVSCLESSAEVCPETLRDAMKMKIDSITYTCRYISELNMVNNITLFTGNNIPQVCLETPPYQCVVI